MRVFIKVREGRRKGGISFSHVIIPRDSALVASFSWYQGTEWLDRSTRMVILHLVASAA